MGSRWPTQREWLCFDGLGDAIIGQLDSIDPNAEPPDASEGGLATLARLGGSVAAVWLFGRYFLGAREAFGAHDMDYGDAQLGIAYGAVLIFAAAWAAHLRVVTVVVGGTLLWAAGLGYIHVSVDRPFRLEVLLIGIGITTAVVVANRVWSNVKELRKLDAADVDKAPPEDNPLGFAPRRKKTAAAEEPEDPGPEPEQPKKRRRKYEPRI